MTEWATSRPYCVLFIANGAPASRRAHTVVEEAIRQADLDGSLLIDVVDVHLEPRRALKAGCMATPSLLVLDERGAAAWFLGDLSESSEVLAFVRDLSVQTSG